ncbi:hypothetical protein M422DRAFT_53306 [Sphaerobolus stellatus SS14]|uniref:Uncharacterized protein n=1 Tax=Sphaerobolus stellatus (strain SS14) TaxID=990650 RepID=A0A0C9UR48_SPHS4|nr:hypothetical protein M422DRAFT_53306 [Sphaerobolus stellatus SS14]
MSCSGLFNRIRRTSSTIPADPEGEDILLKMKWVPVAIQAGNVIVVVGEVVPIFRRFIRGPAALFVAILQPINKARANKVRCQELSSIVQRLLQTIRKQRSSFMLHGETTLKQDERTMEEILDGLERLASRRNFILACVHASSVEELLIEYERKVQQVKYNLGISTITKLDESFSSIHTKLDTSLKRQQRQGESLTALENHIQHVSQVLEEKANPLVIIYLEVGGLLPTNLCKVILGTPPLDFIVCVIFWIICGILV